MRKNRRTEIVTENWQLIFFKNGNSIQPVCRSCGSDMFKPETAAVALGIGTREIYRRAENGTIHFIEGRDDTFLVCMRSMMKGCD